MSAQQVAGLEGFSVRRPATRMADHGRREADIQPEGMSGCAAPASGRSCVRAAHAGQRRLHLPLAGGIRN